MKIILKETASNQDKHIFPTNCSGKLHLNEDNEIVRSPGANLETIDPVLKSIIAKCMELTKALCAEYEFDERAVFC